MRRLSLIHGSVLSRLRASFYPSLPSRDHAILSHASASLHQPGIESRQASSGRHTHAQHTETNPDSRGLFIGVDRAKARGDEEEEHAL